ncbi:DUF6998 domain-containing protein [Alkalilimnicola ehrlichii MLHE-1]|uniref:DUF6998 domain-containing protein n=1 Tax=Alkalilimnicola ehrlichii (strain ATCC BAA-1101 / DSM 17681 / MLHE-1) TaxID=187272 RepID=Q0ABP5_ALKEH|nr:hypothetical protein [Alkalilimnicola ehrlichii]ABI55742.1 hypothetical protein Mlg_0388 [Alkalilimnicola ehrlichii MLHE-1]
MDQKRLPQLIEELYRVVGELEAMFPGRHFTPDGHLVGSLGECLAAHHYGLELLTASSPGVDAIKGELKVEIKATQGQRVALRSGPEHLLVLKLNKRGGFSEVYNGPGRPVWKELERKPRPSNGQYQVSQVPHFRSKTQGVVGRKCLKRLICAARTSQAAVVSRESYTGY